MRIELVEAIPIRFRRETAPAAETSRLQPIDQLDLGSAQHGFVAHMDKRVRFLDAGAEDAARACVGHAVRDHSDIVRQQCRRKSVALVAAVAEAVETEVKWTRPVDAPTRCQAAYGGVISWVTVSRTKLNQRRQPAMCTQRSGILPFGLGRKKTKRAQVASSTLAGSAG